MSPGRAKPPGSIIWCLLIPLSIAGCESPGAVNATASALAITITTGLAERIADPAETIFIYQHERCHQTLGHLSGFHLRRDLRLELAADACAIAYMDLWGIERAAAIRVLARGIRGRDIKGAFAEIATRAAAIRFLPRIE